SKDGYAELDFDSFLPDEEGAANVSLGLKYALYADLATNSIFTVGFEYEIAGGWLCFYRSLCFRRHHYW
ncbi:MAG: hypothetical protein ACJAX5_002926, partial [Patiriisocius sp.]